MHYLRSANRRDSPRATVWKQAGNLLKAALPACAQNAIAKRAENGKESGKKSIWYISLMRTPQTPEVIRTRELRDELLKLVPNKRYQDCTPSEQMRFNNLEAAMQENRAAVREARTMARVAPRARFR